MTREDKLALVGDYVLGLMEGPEQETFEKQITQDPELAAMVDKLADRMASLDAPKGAGPADARLWADIEKRIGALPEQPTPMRPVLQQKRSMRKPPAWMSLAASVVIALGVGYLLGSVNQTQPQPTVIAVLLNEQTAAPAVIVEAFADDSVHLVPLDAFDVPEGSVLQVWTLPSQEMGPVSLGTLDQARDIRLVGPALPSPRDGQLYEITLEPAPGSPTGRPTGPILVKGYAKPTMQSL